jgi:hypothetical protein
LQLARRTDLAARAGEHAERLALQLCRSGAEADPVALAYRGGPGMAEGARFGVLIRLFAVCGFVLHNYVNLNIGLNLTVKQAVAYFAEWTIVGIVIGLIYRPRPVRKRTVVRGNNRAGKELAHPQQRGWRVSPNRCEHCPARGPCGRPGHSTPATAGKKDPPTIPCIKALRGGQMSRVFHSICNRNSVQSTMMAIAILWVLNGALAFAQSGETDVGEVAALGGVAVGGASGTQGTVTGGAGNAFARHGMVLVDTMFMPLGNRTIQPWPDRRFVDRSFLLDFGLDFHIRFPVKPRFAPYGIAGAGLLWGFFREDTVDRRGRPLVRHFDQFNGALHTGGGVRYYIGDNWGIRPEVKVIVSKHVYTLIQMGVFWVAPTNWP